MLKEQILYIAIAVLSTWCIVPGYGQDEQCIKGVYHKDKPSPESDKYEFCTPWKNLTCCTVALDNEIAQNDSPSKYNETWHLCGNLSLECLNFWKRQECFYQCSPYVYQWKDAKYEDTIKGVPICASECDAWYAACKDDRICVENVLEDYNRTVNYVAKCPRDKKCITYAEMYGSGKNLCEKLWGDSYRYVQKDNDVNNCMKMWFTPGSENPNADVRKISPSTTSTRAQSSGPSANVLSTLVLLAVLYAVIGFN